MATLNENIAQAVKDFDDIREAIEYQDVQVPEDAPTSLYSEKIREIDRGITPVGTFEISDNGTYDIATYAEVDVDVRKDTEQLAQLISGQGTTLYVPEGTPQIGRYAFYNNDTLESINIPSSVQTIDEHAFDFCYSLQDVEFEEGVTHIGQQAFQNCIALAQINLPDSITSIETLAFNLCSNLSEIGNLDNVVHVGNDALANTAWYNNQPDGLVYLGKVLYKYKNPNYDTHIEVAPGTLGIAGRAFEESGASRITSIVLPDSLKLIGSEAFIDCTGLTSIQLPDALETIKSRAFNDCTNLSEIQFPDTIIDIGADAFNSTAWYDNQPDGLICIGKVAYTYKGNIAAGTLTIPSGILRISPRAFLNKPNLIAVELPNSLQTIGNNAFDGCSGPPTIQIPFNVTKIEEYAFSSCTMLQTIELPNSIEILEAGAFYECTALYKATLSESMTSIESYVFSGCQRLAYVVIPDSIVEIKFSAFYNCYALKDIYYTGTEEDWSQIAISDSGNEALAKATIHYNYTGVI